MAVRQQLLKQCVVLSLVIGAVSQNTTAGWTGGAGGPPAFVVPCISLFGVVRGTLSSNTTGVSEFCAVNGTFWNAASSMQACLSREVQTIPASGFDDINSALSTCNSFLSASITSSCASLSAKSENCTVSTSFFGQPTVSVMPMTGYASGAVTPAQTVSQQPSATSSQTPVENSGGSNIGLVAGVAVGAAIGALIIAAAVVISIWRYRKRAAAASRDKDVSASSEDDIEKAELQGASAKSDHQQNELGTDLSSERRELAGPPVYARSVGSLQELDASKRQSCIKELASNEEVASEMAATKTEYSGTTATLTHKD